MRYKNVFLMSRMQKTDVTSRCFTQIGNIKRQSLTYGRTDKKFCSDTCKNRYHNNNHRDNRSLHHKVMSGIQKNYEILEKLFAMDIRTIDMGDLISLGFRPEFSTGYKKIRSHDEYRCFEYKYNLSSSRLFNLQRIIPYLK